ncbi:MAG: S-methyl-5'-thioadenosine phosphorylase [Pseudomonadota bacterium]|nr:S-methyl-5'-thioadenosine phosphorylase [Pseudomonadota bacterium]
MKTVLGVIGGSGLYDLPNLTSVRWEQVKSPWGEPSDEVLFAELNGLPVRFLPRHGRGHPLGPGAINYRANIDVLKRAGVTDLVSISACGSLQEALAPGALVLVDQFVDRTDGRPSSFFGEGMVGHVSMADPVSPLLVDALSQAAMAEEIAVTRGGTYLAIEGPQFSTRAESRLYRSWGCDVIGMTNMPEAKLAREAELCYATVAMVTDYDSWRPGVVSVPDMLAVMGGNIDKVQRLILRLMRDLPREHPACPIGSDTALEVAFVTAQARRSPDLLAKLDAVAGRVLGAT